MAEGRASHDTDVLVRSIREKYEERLSGMSDRIRAILEDAKQDEVIATMRGDPASASFVRARMRELADEKLAQEKEETIERLVRELATVKAECQKAERECAAAKVTTRSLEDQLRQERSKSDLSERELSDLRSKSAVSTRQYDESLRKFADESSASLKLAQAEADKMREKLEQTERSLWLKASEIEMVKHDLESEKNRSGKIIVENNSLKRAYQELEADYVQLQESVGNSAEIAQKLSTALKEIEALESTVELYEKEKEELRGKYLAYSREFKEVLEVEQKATSEAMDNLQQQYKAKSSLFKKKIIEQKAKLQALEASNAELRSELEGTRQSYEQSFAVIQTDLRRVRDEWERKCQETETAARAQIAELTAKHKAQVAALQQAADRALEDKTKELTETFEAQVAVQRNCETELRRTMEERSLAVEKDYVRLSRHEAILTEEINKAKGLAVRAAEEQLSAEFARKVATIKEEHEGEVQKLVLRARSAEDQEEAANTYKRKAERELEYANERIEALSGKLTALMGEIGELESGKKAYAKSLEESGTNLSKLRTMYEDELARRKSLEEQLTAQKDRTKALESTLSQKEMDFHQQLHTTRLKHIEENAKMQEALEKEIALTRKQNSEIQKLKESHESLHVEKRELHDFHTKTAEELKQNSLKLKQEHLSRYEEEVAAHLETQSSLAAKSRQVDSLLGDVEDLQRKLLAEAEKVANCNRELEAAELRADEEYRERQKILAENSNLAGKLAKARNALQSFRAQMKRTVRNLTQEYQGNLRNCQRSLQSELAEFKKFMSKQVAESMAGVEDLQLKQRRANTLALLAKEDLIRAAEKEKSRCEEQMNESLESQAHRYESHIDSLKSALAQLQAEVNHKDLEITDFLQKITAYQKEQEVLRSENHSLQSELQSTVNELEYSKLEESRLKSSFQEEIAGRELAFGDKYKSQLVKLEELVGDLKAKNEANMARFQEDVRQLQERHKSELTALEANYMRQVDKLQRDLQLAEERRLSLSEAVEEAALEVTNMRAECCRQMDLMEDEIGDLLSALHSDHEKYSTYRQEKSAELEEFGRRLKLITRELQEKEEILERTNRDKETLRSQLKEIRDSQMQKDILDLRSSVEKSMSASAKISKPPLPKSEDDSEKPSESRKLPLSLTQLKASLDKYA